MLVAHGFGWFPMASYRPCALPHQHHQHHNHHRHIHEPSWLISRVVTMTRQDVGAADPSPILTSPSPMISPASLDESDTEVESPLTAPEREEAPMAHHAACSSTPAAGSSAATPSSSATAAGSSATAPSSATAKSTLRTSAATTRRDRKIRAGKPQRSCQGEEGKTS